jgi:hypothetical protein
MLESLDDIPDDSDVVSDLVPSRVALNEVIPILPTSQDGKLSNREPSAEFLEPSNFGEEDVDMSRVSNESEPSLRGVKRKADVLEISINGPVPLLDESEADDVEDTDTEEAIVPVRRNNPDDPVEQKDTIRCACH